MFRWGKSRKNEEAEPAAGAARQPGGADDWDFLRAQPDYDADEMQAVHGDEAEAPSAAASAPAWESEPSPIAPAPSLLDLPDPEEPWRRPKPVERSVVHGAPAELPPHREGEHATKPLTLLSALCAKFQDPAEVRSEAERPYPPTPGWAVTLEITVRGRSSRRSVFGEAVLGRVDPDAGHQPDVDLSADDTVSRRHALILERHGRFFLRDLESMNGTRVNGQWLQPGGETPLEHGDEIEIGEFCRLEVVDPEMPVGDDLRDFLQVALGGTLYAEQQGAAPTPILNSDGDVLNLALQRGQEVGLLRDHSGHES